MKHLILSLVVNKLSIPRMYGPVGQNNLKFYFRIVINQIDLNQVSYMLNWQSILNHTKIIYSKIEIF